ncbi:TonB-dependent receptor [Thalassotalea fonticola]|uniref:TonB-dependent receptor n=1 Tax=Thalassotalea fonticola TaxID=3065649 RepID=A0ABZ0GKZ4_9GAMM|nr:TonB-dependent receptor [Colwelliaceae bacterium S1-1]
MRSSKDNIKFSPIAICVAIALNATAVSSYAADSSQAAAQNASNIDNPKSTDTSIEKETNSIEVVTVTARHKIESLQSTPIAVSAFSSDQMKEQRIVGLDDISSRVPGFQMNMYNSAEPELFMRGIGSDVESAGAATAVGMYIDGVYISRGTSAAMDLYDLQSVEVLRGPQGTLYGKNVVGGAINFITKRPVDGDMEGSMEATVGDYGLMEVKGYATGGLTENIAGKLALSGTTRDGYGENTHTGNDADETERMSARGQLLYTPTDDLEFLLTAAVSDLEGTPRVKHIGYSAGRNAAFISTDPRKDTVSEDGYEESDNSSVSLQINWSFDNLQFTSISAYRDNEYSIYENGAAGLVDDTIHFDPWGDPANNNPLGIDDDWIANTQVDDEWLVLKAEESDQISQEFRLAGDLNESFSWLVGAFYMEEDIARNELVDYWFHTQWGTTAGNRANDNSLGNTTHNITTSYAIFTNATYNFTEKLSMTTGIRWSKDEKEFSGTAFGRRFDNWDTLHEDLDGNRVDSYAFETSDSWDEWTPSLNIDYQANKDVFLYGSIAKGYKAGGFNGEGPESAKEAIVPFLPEVAWNYETGFKVQGFEDRLRVNGAIFYTDYTDIQSAVWVDGGGTGIPNLVVINGSGEAQGFELEVTALATDNLTLSGSYGYLDTEFTKDVFIDDDNLNGNKMRRTPEHSLNINLAYEWKFFELGDATARLSYQYQSDFFFDNSNEPLTMIDSQYTFDAVFMLRDFDNNWSLQLWAKNLTDELNVASKTLYAAWDDTVYNVYTPPRTVGITATYNF